MAMKPKVAARVAARKQAVGAMKQKGVKAGEARKRFYVQTRAAELSAKGVKVDKAKRQELRKKFASGDVSRKGFKAPAKRASTKTAPAKKTGPKSVTLPSGKKLVERDTPGGKRMR
jgi:hypothetical protein